MLFQTSFIETWFPVIDIILDELLPLKPITKESCHCFWTWVGCSAFVYIGMDQRLTETYWIPLGKKISLPTVL